MGKIDRDLEAIAPELRLVTNESGLPLVMNPGETEWDDIDQPHCALAISEKIPKTTSIHPTEMAASEEKEE